MARGTVPLLIAAAALSAAITWLVVKDDDGALSLSGDADADAARIAELEAEVDRLVEQNRDLSVISVDAPPATGARTPAPKPSPAPGSPTEPIAEDVPVDAFRQLRGGGPTVPKNVPPGMRGTPKMWLEGMRIALEKGDSALADYYRMALVALGDEAIEPVVSLLANEGASPDLRYRALAALKQLDPSRVATIAADWLASTREASPMRTAMLEALSTGATTVPKRVVQIAWDDEEPAADRLLALRAMARADPDEASDTLRRLLRNGSVAERSIAYSMLAQASDPRMRPVIEEALEQGSPIEQRALLGALAAMKGPAWGNEQMTGPPDTTIAGDNHTAWASAAAQEGVVWVELDFPIAVVPGGVRVHETYNAGAIVKVEVLAAGRYVTVWEGEARGAATPRWFVPPLAETRDASRTIRMTLDTNAVSGWNEIDAVELIGDGQRQWATVGRSSSCYAHRK